METFRRTHSLRYPEVFQIEAQEEIKNEVIADKIKGIKERNKAKCSFKNISIIGSNFLRYTLVMKDSSSPHNP